MLFGTLTDALEQAIPPLRPGWRIDHNERFVDESRQQVQHVFRRDAVSVANGLSGFQRPSTREDCEPVEQQSFGWSEQRVAPLDGRGERLVARSDTASSLAEQAESFVQLLEDLLGRKESGACGRKLDWQWKAIQPATDLRDEGRFNSGGGHQARLRRRSPFSEQAHRFGFPKLNRAPRFRRPEIRVLRARPLRPARRAARGWWRELLSPDICQASARSARRRRPSGARSCRGSEARA